MTHSTRYWKIYWAFNVKVICLLIIFSRVILIAIGTLYGTSLVTTIYLATAH